MQVVRRRLNFSAGHNQSEAWAATPKPPGWQACGNIHNGNATRAVEIADEFDPGRRATLVVAGDAFYREQIRKAAKRFDAHR
ncbi:MAG TPA: hypothetical protein VG675_10875 [Bryobacteraceae bacterium]|nr:hypothetical protein [Bryobacteraceae bacterium]